MNFMSNNIIIYFDSRALSWSLHLLGSLSTGNNSSGAKYINEAILKGAAAIVSEKRIANKSNEISGVCFAGTHRDTDGVHRPGSCRLSAGAETNRFGPGAPGHPRHHGDPGPRLL